MSFKGSILYFILSFVLTVSFSLFLQVIDVPRDYLVPIALNVGFLLGPLLDIVWKMK